VGGATGAFGNGDVGAFRPTRNPLPRAYWTPLFLAADQAMASQSGLINFAHDFLRQAVRCRYLPTEKERQKEHIRSADYFEPRSIGAHKIDELPWQLAQAKEWKRLNDLLVNEDFFLAVWNNDQFEAKTYWAQVESNSSLSLVKAYKPVLDIRLNNTDFIWKLSFLLGDTGHPQEALRLREFLIDCFRKTRDRANLAASLGDKALILQDRGDLDGAMAIFTEILHIFREIDDKDGIHKTFGNQALIRKARGDLNGSMTRQKEKERICRDLGLLDSLAVSLGNQANIFSEQGDLDGAMSMQQEKGSICERLGNKEGLSRSWLAQALILHRKEKEKMPSDLLMMLILSPRAMGIKPSQIRL
jgi:tetratricopeptide (TPR) repeat protein